MMPTTREEFKGVVKEAIHETFEEIGIDITTTSGRLIWRKNFERLKTISDMTDNIASKVGWAIIVLAISGALYLIGLGAKLKMISGGG